MYQNPTFTDLLIPFPKFYSRKVRDTQWLIWIVFFLCNSNKNLRTVYLAKNKDQLNKLWYIQNNGILYYSVNNVVFKNIEIKHLEIFTYCSKFKHRVVKQYMQYKSHSFYPFFSSVSIPFLDNVSKVPTLFTNILSQFSGIYSKGKARIMQML